EVGGDVVNGWNGLARLPVEHRYVDEGCGQGERNEQHGAAAGTQPRPLARESEDGEDEGDGREQPRSRHQPVEAEAISPPTEAQAERPQCQEAQCEGRQHQRSNSTDSRQSHRGPAIDSAYPLGLSTAPPASAQSLKAPRL